MAGTLKFNISELEQVINSSTEKIMLVGDQGIYFCSDAAPQGQTKKVLAYGLGTNPNKDKDFYEKKQQIFGGDDGIESYTKEDMLEMLAVAKKHSIKQLTVKFSAKATKISLRQ
jgi:hypothetical protein